MSRRSPAAVDQSVVVSPPPYRHVMVVAFEDEEFEPVGTMRVRTESSIWFVTTDRYQRMPLEERPRPPVVSVEGRLADGEWHSLRRCWWRVHADGERQLRLLPEAGPVDGIGVLTGVVVVVKGRWIPIVTAADDLAATPRPALGRLTASMSRDVDDACGDQR
jgi:hypothetical protein